MKEKGVVLSYKYESNDTNVIQGISFTKGEVTFKGSEVDRNFSYSKIDTKLQDNQNALNQSLTKPIEDTAQSQKQDKDQSQTQGASPLGSLINGIGLLSAPIQSHGDDYEEERFRNETEYRQKKINKKNKKRPKGRGVNMKNYMTIMKHCKSHWMVLPDYLLCRIIIRLILNQVRLLS